jgi:eukaryotic-like serine/threonine-protein kinase
MYGVRYVPDPAHKPASGGQGQVVICDDTNLERKVAVKFLQPGVDEKRIMDEVRALQTIRSKHVVQMYDVTRAQPGNFLGIVQEYLPGPDLRGFAKRKPTPREYLLVLYQLAIGLEDVHAHDQIHRDIKPSNVRYDQEHVLKIFDFGLARVDDGNDNVTHGFRGTPGYAAPELYVPGRVEFTKAVDVYAFGATALILAKGKLPAEFLENPPRAEAWSRLGFATLPFGVPPRVAAVLDRCLRTAPEARPTMREIRETLHSHLVEGRHRALLVYAKATHVCDKSAPTVKIGRASIGEIQVHYDGFTFEITSVQGACYVNNTLATAGDVLPGSCVITLGAPDLKTARLFVTIDVSHPEVVA